MQTTQTRACAAHQAHGVSRGFTLLEVLVAIIVIAVSVLGLAALLGRVHTNAYGALLRTDASILLTDMAERIMANRANVIATPAGYTVAMGAALDCSKAPAAVADLDLWQFRCLAKQSLPVADGSVTPDAAANPTNVTIQVRWDDSRGGSGSSTQTLTQVVNLK